MTCHRYHIEITEKGCLSYQNYHELTFPAAHPCRGCDRREMIKKKVRPLVQRQGGRHKEEDPGSQTPIKKEKKKRPPVVIKAKCEFCGDYYSYYKKNQFIIYHDCRQAKLFRKNQHIEWVKESHRKYLEKNGVPYWKAYKEGKEKRNDTTSL